MPNFVRILRYPVDNWPFGQLRFIYHQHVTQIGIVQRTKYSYRSGSRPFDGYTIKRGIGVGGFGEVYFAVSQAGKEVALKKIQRNLDIELRGVQQCLNLKHVNLISLWDIRINEYGENWVVMEYVPGPSLRDVVEAYPDGMPEPQIKAWFTAIASGVAYLHEKGIVHRDLKPGNIFCDEHVQVVKIGDYGLSKFISSSKRDQQTGSVGTFHYMAPEIGNGIYGKEIDIYALGVVLFEMLTGTVPFNGESSQEIMMKHLTASPDLSLAPQPFHTVIRKSMLKDPQERYSTIHEMLRDLPWQDVVNNSHKIVSWHSVGAILETSDIPRASQAYPTDAHPGGLNNNHQQLVAETHYASHSLEATPVLVESGPGEMVVPDIQFGPIKHGQPPKEAGVFRRARTLLDTDMQGPVMRLLGGPFPRFAEWWNAGQISTPVKVVLLAIAVAVAMTQSNWLVPTSLAVGFLYVVYYTLIAYDARGAVSKMLLQRDARRAQNNAVRNWIGSQPVEDRATDLIGALLGSAVSCVALTFFGLAINGRFLNPSLESWALYLWATVIGILLSWTVLAMGKAWEYRSEGAESSGQRRLSLLLAGFLVGAAAFGLARVFDLDLLSIAVAEKSVPDQPLLANRIALLPACLLTFSGLLGVLRWWRQVDPLRRTRISVWNVGLSMLWAIVLGSVLSLPASYVCIVAFSVSVSIQFAAPWLSTAQRQPLSAANPQEPA